MTWQWIVIIVLVGNILVWAIACLSSTREMRTNNADATADAHPVYRIVTFDDFLDVPEERLADCLDELETALRTSIRIRNNVVRTFGSPSGRLPMLGAFIWKDDGRKDATFNIRFRERSR